MKQNQDLKELYLKGFEVGNTELEADLKEHYPHITSENYSVLKSRFIKEKHLDFSNMFCQGSEYKEVLPKFETQLFKDVKDEVFVTLEECFNFSTTEIKRFYSGGTNSEALIDKFFKHGEDHIVYDLGRMAAWAIFGMRSYAVCTWIDFEAVSGRPVVLQRTDENGIACLNTHNADAMKCLIVSKYGIKTAIGGIIDNPKKEVMDFGIYCQGGCESKIKALYDILIANKYISPISEEKFLSHFNGGFPEEKINWIAEKYLLIRMLDKMHPYLNQGSYYIKGEAISFLFEVAQQHFTINNEEIGAKTTWETARSQIKHEKVDFLKVKKIDDLIQSLEKIKKNTNDTKL